MPKRDMQSVWSMLHDLARELSWTMRIGFFGGLALGGCYAAYLVSGVPAVEVRRGFVKVLFVFVVGSMALGGFLGLAAGAAVEWASKSLRKKDDPPRRKR